ncbi:sugar ABC transporter permease [Ruminococcus sp. CLA-AA-H200]|uniref:Sugar ABC transporter permease n=1 Tax=Ruminococcus turbiniformis TaxID=2881258 RepID=A0ABS8FZI4_9FIRM|nr:sugar ABC transporter permease [Ruminococcus turbiniformis]MCC2255376.1 sugar ABC transporter permease [Ruminococcus turbiniformis]
MEKQASFTGRGRVKKKKRLSKRIEPFLYLAPALIFFVGFTYYPFAKTVFSSFFLVNSMGEIREFVGLENFISVLTNPAFLQSIKNTLIYVVMSSPIAIFIALLLAMIANRKTKLSPVYEMLYAITMAVSMSVAAMIFQLMYNPTIGILNYIFNTHFNWLNDKKIAMIALSLIAVWLNIGYNFLFLLSAVRGISSDLLESADIDGANFFQRTFKIIVPIISPTVFYLICNSLAKNMMMSGLVLILTQGAPQGSTETMISFMYKQSVNNLNYNDGYAAAIIAFIITSIAMAFSFSFEKKGVHYN